MMATPVILWMSFTLVFSLCAHADFVEETLVVHNKVVWRLCKSQEITVVNGSFPGPAIYVHEGDSIAINVINNSPYNMTIHWHGVFQLMSNWQDGPAFITQCPILPGNKYTYRFNITGQEGTLFWHAHIGWHRATIHGPFIIYPKRDNSYPFMKPDGEFPITIGEWFNSSVENLEKQQLFTGNNPNISQGLTINGWLGDFYSCSLNRRLLTEDPQIASLQLSADETGPIPDDIYKVKVKKGKTYLLRIVCATLNQHAFFKIANHKLTVVAIDAVYTIPYTTDVITISSGQTVDVLITADQQPTTYYMASTYYVPVKFIVAPPIRYKRDATPQTAVLIYEEADTSTNFIPILPNFPDADDYEVGFNFFSNLKGLENGPHWLPVPHQVDEHMLITVGFGTSECMHKDQTLCLGPYFRAVAASLNNASFVLPARTSILDAYYNNISGIYTTDFPNEPLNKYDFANSDIGSDPDLMWVDKGTKVKKLKYNSTVEIVLQNTALIEPESHPIHLHGFNFYVLAQAYGNYDRINDYKKFNLVNPHMRNTISVPVGGWVAIRFRANNPGVWYMHCHLEDHVTYGLATAFIVEDGPTPSTKLPPRPANFPSC